MEGGKGLELGLVCKIKKGILFYFLKDKKTKNKIQTLKKNQKPKKPDGFSENNGLRRLPINCKFCYSNFRI